MKQTTRSLHMSLWALLTTLVFVGQTLAVERIVSLAPNWSHTVASIGAEDELVGVTRYARFPQSLPDKVAKGELAVVGGFTDIDVDKVLSLKPSIVLTATGLQLRLKKQLEGLGIRVIHMQESSLQEVYTKVSQLGLAIGRHSEASELISNVQQELAKIKQQYMDRPRVKVYYEINYLYKCVPGADSYITELIEIAGGDPVFSERSGIAPVVNWDEIVSVNPDLILLPMWPGATGPVFEGKDAGSGTTTIEEVASRNNATSVNAVINKQVKFIDSAVTKQAGPSIPFAAKIFAKAIHGE